MQKNNAPIALVVGIILLICSIPIRWMTLHNVTISTPRMPDGFPQMPGHFPSMSGMSFSVNGLNGNITLGVELPIWLIVVIGVIGLVLLLLNQFRVAAIPRWGILLPLGISLVYVLYGFGVMIISDEVSMGAGVFLALAGLGIGLWSVLKTRSVPGD